MFQHTRESNTCLPHATSAGEIPCCTLGKYAASNHHTAWIYALLLDTLCHNFRKCGYEQIAELPVDRSDVLGDIPIQPQYDNSCKGFQDCLVDSHPDCSKIPDKGFYDEFADPYLLRNAGRCNSHAPKPGRVALSSLGHDSQYIHPSMLHFFPLVYNPMFSAIFHDRNENKSYVLLSDWATSEFFFHTYRKEPPCGCTAGDLGLMDFSYPNYTKPCIEAQG